MNISKKWFIETNLFDILLICITIFYLVLPILIFAFGWMKPIFAVIFSSLVVWGSANTLTHFKYRNYTINLKRILFIVILVVILAAWLWLSGIGGFGLQSGDYNGRNAIFRDLINHNWPVRYSYFNHPEMQHLFGPSGAMVYYFLFWLPAALVGKLFGWQQANAGLFLWSFAGLIVVVYLLFRKIGKTSLWIVIGFILFSGMDILFSGISNGGASIVVGSQPPGFLKRILLDIWSTNHIEWWCNVLFQYSSITTQLYNVFNQAIPAWIVTLLILDLPDRKDHIFIYSLLALFAPLPFIGLFPFVFQKSVSPEINFRRWLTDCNNKIQSIKQHVFSVFQENLSFQNVVVGGIVLIVSFTFLSSNCTTHESGFIWKFYPKTEKLILLYFAFCMMEFFILGLLIFKNNSEKGLLILTLVLLFLIPIFKYGMWNDFSMRVSIPSLIVLFVLVVKKIGAANPGHRRFKTVIQKSMLIIILLIGSITPLHEIHRSVNAMIASHGSPALQDQWCSFDYGGDMAKMKTVSNYVIGDPDNKLFFQIFGK